MTRIVLELFHVFKLLSFFLASTGVPVSDNILTYHQPTYLPPTYLIWNKALLENYYCMHTFNSDLHNEKNKKECSMFLESLRQDFGAYWGQLEDFMETTWLPL